MIDWVETNTSWEYVLRTSPQIYVQTKEHNQPIRDYPLEQGQVLSLQNVGFTQTPSSLSERPTSNDKLLK